MILRKYLFSILYRTIRFSVKFLVSFFQFISGQKKDLESIVEFGDSNLIRINKYFGSFAYSFPIPKDIAIEVYDLKFKSPLIAASFKSEKDLIDIWLKLGLGGAVFKTIMSEKRNGNHRPRLQQVRLERQACLVNALGLPGEGVESFSNSIIDSPLWSNDKPLGLSIGGENFDNYIHCFDTIEKQLKTSSINNYFYELNISCPNTDTGSCLGDNLSDLEKLIDYMRRYSSKVISIKVSPDWEDEHLKSIGDIILAKEKMIVNAGNTQFKTIEYLGLKKDSLPRGGGGLSGLAIFPRTLQMINLFSDMSLIIMATGGISTVHHLNAARDAGATLFGMATSLIMDPYCIPKINYNLSKGY